MKLTVEGIKGTVRSSMIDHQQLKIVNLCKISQYLGGDLKLGIKDWSISVRQTGLIQFLDGILWFFCANIFFQ